FSSRRRHTRFSRDWSSDVCSSDLTALVNGRIFNGDTIFLDHALVMQGDRIHGIFPEYALPENVDRVDVHQANVCAGLIDLQIYEIGRASCREGVWVARSAVGW